MLGQILRTGHLQCERPRILDLTNWGGNPAILGPRPTLPARFFCRPTIDVAPVIFAGAAAAFPRHFKGKKGIRFLQVKRLPAFWGEIGSHTPPSRRWSNSASSQASQRKTDGFGKRNMCQACA